MHEFLVTEDGMSKSAEMAVRIREYIDGLSSTTASFSTRHIDTIDHTAGINPLVIELAKAWPMNDHYSNKYNRYVNPNYRHTDYYCDIVVECECGARMVSAYDKGQRIQDEHDHNPGCMPYMRLEARAKIQRQRHQLTEHCARLGWKGEDIAKRVGMSRNSITSLLSECNTSLTKLRSNFTRHAAETYVYLVRVCGYDAETVGNIYGKHYETIANWARTHNITKDTEFTKNDAEQFTWRKS